MPAIDYLVLRFFLLLFTSYFALFFVLILFHSQPLYYIYGGKNGGGSEVFFSYEIVWAVFCFDEDATEIFAYYAEREQLYAAEKEDDDDYRGEALHRFAYEDCLDEHEYHVGEGGKRAYQTENGGYAQRRGGVGCDAFDGEIKQLEVVERRFAAVSSLLFEAHLTFLEAYPAEQALGVALRFAHYLHRLDTFAVEQTEVAHVGQHVYASRLFQYFVIHQREFASHEALLAPVLSFAVHIVEALFPQTYHVGDHGGRVLQVGIHYYGAVARCTVKSGEHGALFAEVARQSHISYPLVGQGYAFYGGESVVSTAVVDEKQFPFVAFVAVGHAFQRVVKLRYVALFVVAGYYDGYGFHYRLLLRFITSTLFLSTIHAQSNPLLVAFSAIRRASLMYVELLSIVVSLICLGHRYPV